MTNKVALTRQKSKDTHTHAHTYTWDTEQYHTCDSECVCQGGCVRLWVDARVTFGLALFCSLLAHHNFGRSTLDTIMFCRFVTVFAASFLRTTLNVPGLVML